MCGSGVRAMTPKMPSKHSSYYPFHAAASQDDSPLVADGSAVVLRTQNDPTTIVAALRRAVSELDPGAVIYAVDTMDGTVTKSLAARRLSLVLLAGFAVLALALSCMGSLRSSVLPGQYSHARDRSARHGSLVPIAAIFFVSSSLKEYAWRW